MKTLQTMKWIQFALLLSALALPTVALTGCNTSKGFGKDIESVGDEIQDEADEAAD
jgi:predicted small secreted protein